MKFCRVLPLPSSVYLISVQQRWSFKLAELALMCRTLPEASLHLWSCVWIWCLCCHYHSLCVVFHLGSCLLCTTFLMTGRAHMLMAFLLSCPLVELSCMSVILASDNSIHSCSGFPASDCLSAQCLGTLFSCFKGDTTTMLPSCF